MHNLKIGDKVYYRAEFDIIYTVTAINGELIDVVGSDHYNYTDYSGDLIKIKKYHSKLYQLFCVL